MTRSTDEMQGGLTATAPRRGVRWVFMGDEGLRAGWGALLFLVLAGVLQIPVVLVLGLLNVHQADLMRDAASPRGVAMSVSLGLFGVVIATVLMARIERRSAAAYGLGLRRSLLRFTQGVLVGLLLMSALAGLLLLSGGLVLDGVALQGAAAWHSGLAWAGAYLLVALFEELTTRGYLLQALGRGLGFRWAAVLTSAIFALGHLKNVGEGFIGLVAVMLIGLVLSYSVWRLGSLWWAIGFHTAWNWAQSFLFGVANSGFAGEGHLLTTHPTGPAWLSGGATGPEGSVWNLLIIGVVGLAVYVTSRTPRAQATASGG